MIEIVELLVFAIVMLLFMAFPAMKMSEYIAMKFQLEKRVENILMIVFDIALSLGVALFLKYF